VKDTCHLCHQLLCNSSQTVAKIYGGHSNHRHTTSNIRSPDTPSIFGHSLCAYYLVQFISLYYIWYHGRKECSHKRNSEWRTRGHFLSRGMEVVYNYSRALSRYISPRNWQYDVMKNLIASNKNMTKSSWRRIAVAIPKITTVFNSLDDVGWYGSVYLLTVTSFQPSFGKLYKILNSKLVYLTCIFIFEGMPTSNDLSFVWHATGAGSVLCAAAPNSSVFILGRAIAGLGAAGLLQGALQVVMISVPLEKRPFYMGIIVSVFGIAICFGPVLGGFFTDHDQLTWRWCFWVNLPVGAIAFFLIVVFLRMKQAPLSAPSFTRHMIWRELDPLGCLAILSAVCCLRMCLDFLYLLR